MKLSELKDKKVLILGFGREGRDTFLFLRKLFPKKIIGIADQKKLSHIYYDRRKNGIKLYLGKNYLKSLKDYDVIIKSPGIPFKFIQRTDLCKVTTQTEIFFQNCPGKIIGITGTKGKSTTASLIYQILKRDGAKAHLVGNIGKPVLNLLFSATPKDVYVYELSSHQLYNLKKSPHIAVLLNIYPEHLDYYRNFKEYIQAKMNIARYQTKNDYLIYNSHDKNIKNQLVGKTSRAKFRARKIPIKGDYYDLDKAAARAVGRIFRIHPKTISKVISKFKPLPHRLELAGTFKGITFYNDSLATIPEATISAIEKLGDRVETIILGGYERNIDFRNLAKKILKSKIKTLILFPTTGKRIWQTILKEGRGGRLPKYFLIKKKKAGPAMTEAVKLAYQYTNKRKICLLSTASASFGLFKDYREKGNLFKKSVKRLANVKKLS